MKNKIKNFKTLQATVLAFILGFYGLNLSAQGKLEFNYFIGGASTDYIKVDDLGAECYDNDLYSLYSAHYSVESGPVLSLNANYVLNRFVRVGAQANWTYLSGTFWYTTPNSLNGTDFKNQLFSVLPQVKLMIPSPDHFRLYGKFAAGVRFASGDTRSDTGYSEYPIKNPVDFAWQITPIGFEWGGHRVYGNAELCYGSILRGAMIGMGFRF
ncbi:MAG: hypothetical protein K5984_01060 [Bacteroidales bacterium]|nr:hypothetical protein [Bacteroidales bacterium]